MLSGTQLLEEDTIVLTGFVNGAIFAERFRIETLLGVGAMGKVFRAVDMQTNQIVAIKVLHADKARKEQVLQRFRREASILGEVDHPGIVRVIDSGTAPDGTDFLVMELLEGGTLRDRLRERGPMSALELVPVIIAVADALGAAHHKGVVHRDLKPDNIFLTKQGGVKVVDFGLSMLDTDKRMTKTGVMLGTPRYMAPEQIRSAKDVDPRVDVYALAICVHEALTGGSPFPAEDAGQLLGCVIEGRIHRIEDQRADLPAGVGDVIRRGMNKDRGQRFATIGAFAEAYARACGVTVTKPRGSSTTAVEDPTQLRPVETSQGPVAVPAPAEKPRFTMPEVTASGRYIAVAPSPAPAPKKKRSRFVLFAAIFVVLVLVTACVAAVAAFGVRGVFGNVGDLDDVVHRLR
jgi:serine/threonine protein kinase